MTKEETLKANKVGRGGPCTSERENLAYGRSQWYHVPQRALALRIKVSDHHYRYTMAWHIAASCAFKAQPQVVHFFIRQTQTLFYPSIYSPAKKSPISRLSWWPTNIRQTWKWKPSQSWNVVGIGKFVNIFFVWYFVDMLEFMLTRGELVLCLSYFTAQQAFSVDTRGQLIPTRSKTVLFNDLLDSQPR